MANWSCSHNWNTTESEEECRGEGAKPGHFTSQTFGFLAPVLILLWLTGAYFLNVRPMDVLDIHNFPIIQTCLASGKRIHVIVLTFTFFFQTPSA